MLKGTNTSRFVLYENTLPKKKSYLIRIVAINKLGQHREFWTFYK